MRATTLKGQIDVLLRTVKEDELKARLRNAFDQDSAFVADSLWEFIQTPLAIRNPAWIPSLRMLDSAIMVVALPASGVPRGGGRGGLAMFADTRGSGQSPVPSGSLPSEAVII